MAEDFDWLVKGARSVHYEFFSKLRNQTPGFLNDGTTLGLKQSEQRASFPHAQTKIIMTSRQCPSLL